MPFRPGREESRHHEGEMGDGHIHCFLISSNLATCYFCKHMDFKRGLDGLEVSWKTPHPSGPLGKMQMDLGLSS